MHKSHMAKGLTLQVRGLKLTEATCPLRALLGYFALLDL